MVEDYVFRLRGKQLMKQMMPPEKVNKMKLPLKLEVYKIPALTVIPVLIRPPVCLHFS